VAVRVPVPVCVPVPVPGAVASAHLEGHLDDLDQWPCHPPPQGFRRFLLSDRPGDGDGDGDAYGDGDGHAGAFK
jgi:hypothetical protein